MRTDPLREHLHQEIKKICRERRLSYKDGLQFLKRENIYQEFTEKHLFDPKRDKIHRKILFLSLQNKISYREALKILREQEPELFK